MTDIRTSKRFSMEPVKSRWLFDGLWKVDESEPWGLFLDLMNSLASSTTENDFAPPREIHVHANEPGRQLVIAQAEELK